MAEIDRPHFTWVWNHPNFDLTLAMSRKILTDAQWAAISPLLPVESLDYQPANRLFVEGLLWLGITGSVWQEWPAALGNGHEAFERTREWLKEGIWTKVLAQVPPHSEAAEVLQQLIGNTAVLLP